MSTFVWTRHILFFSKSKPKSKIFLQYSIFLGAVSCGSSCSSAVIYIYSIATRIMRLIQTLIFNILIFFNFNNSLTFTVRACIFLPYVSCWFKIRIRVIFSRWPFIRYSLYIFAFKNTRKQFKDFSDFKCTVAKDFLLIFLNFQVIMARGFS
jgi:hypothetical protein